MKAKKKMLLNTNFLLFGVGALIAIVAAGSYHAGKTSQTNLKSSSGNPLITNNSEYQTQENSQVNPTADATRDWKTYTNTKYEYSLKYPTTLSLYEDNTYYHYLEFKRIGAAQGEFPVFYIAAIKNTYIAKNPASVNYMSSDVINNFFTLKVGESKKVDTSTFTRSADRKIGGENALVLKVTATGINQDRFYVKHGENMYMFVSDNPTEDFQNFLNSIKFTK